MASALPELRSPS